MGHRPVRCRRTPVGKLTQLVNSRRMPAMPLYTHNVVSSGRHPKKPIADALAAVARPGLRVDQIHKAHRWGVLVCEVCGDDLSLWSTPSVPKHVAKRVHRFAGRHRHEEDR